MKTIGFSEHIAYPHIEIAGERMYNQDIDEYLRTMYQLKEQYKDRIEVLVGFEIEYYEDQKDYLLEMRKRCDYMIVGQHYRYCDGYNYDYFNHDEDVLVYAHQIERALETGLTRYIAHPDFFMLGRRQWTPACDQASQILVEAARKYHAVLEINLNGIRYGKLSYHDGLAYAYPHPHFFKHLTKDHRVCFGYDAHHPTTLLEYQRIDICLDILKDCELTFLEDIHDIL